MSRTHATLATLLLAASLATPLAAQTDVDFGIRAGPQWNTNSVYGGGAAAAVSVDFFNPRFPHQLGLRFEGMVVSGRHAYRGKLPGEPDPPEPRDIDLGIKYVPVVTAGAVLRETDPAAPVRLHALLGLSYTRYPAGMFSSPVPWGPAVSLGAYTRALPPGWSFEAGARAVRVSGGFHWFGTLSLGLLL